MGGADLNCTKGSAVGLPGLMGLWPTGEYRIDITSGTLAGLSLPFFLWGHEFASNTPYFLGTGYSQMQFCRAGVPQTVNWLRGEGVPYGETHIRLVDYTQDGLPWGEGGAIESYTSQTIPGSVLRSGHHYRLKLVYETAYTAGSYSLDGGLNMIYAQAFFHRGTHINFQVQANPGTVAGVFHLGQVGSPNFENFSVDVLDSSGNVLESHDLQTGHYGYYAFDSALRGTYSVRYRTPKFISRIIHNVDFAAGENNIVAELPNGDIDENGEVGIGDYLILAEFFDRRAGQRDWATVLGNGFAPREADISRDSAVGLTDYLILLSNFDLVSE